MNDYLNNQVMHISEYSCSEQKTSLVNVWKNTAFFVRKKVRNLNGVNTSFLFSAKNIYFVCKSPTEIYRIVYNFGLSECNRVKLLML